MGLWPPNSCPPASANDRLGRSHAVENSRFDTPRDPVERFSSNIFHQSPLRCCCLLFETDTAAPYF